MIDKDILSKINVLYVEDEQSLRESTCRTLDSIIKQVIPAENGLEGFKKFKEHFENDSLENFDIIVTDINMPKMDGFEMLSKIKEIEPSIVSVVTTAYNDIEFLQKAINSGIRGYTMKPIDIKQLVESISTTVEPVILKKELEEKNRDLEIQKEQLIKEKQKAQSALEAIEKQKEKHENDIVKNTKFSIVGQMAAGITHEINTPLTYIKGTTEMSRYDLEDMPDNEFKQRLLDDNKKVMDGIKRMSIIVESMREVSQKSTGEKVEFNVYSTLVIVLRMIYNRSKQISPIYLNGELFDLETSNKDKYEFIALVHKQRIEQVWTIILNNALDELIKINDFNNRRIDINISMCNKAIKVEFQDNAGGVSENIIGKIFEPFVSTKESSGIGIGLNVAKKVIDEHDGNIAVVNKNNGACFTVRLITEKRQNKRRQDNNTNIKYDNRITVRRKSDIQSH